MNCAVSTVRRQHGLSLIELMVAMVVGLITVLVVMQVFLGFEGDKRTTSGGADAQTNGGLALYNIRRQIMMAGYGLLPFSSVPSPFVCNETGTMRGSDLFPVLITDGGAGSDSITIRYGNSPTGGVPLKVLQAPLGGVVGVANSMACVVNDLALELNTTGTCYARTVTAIPDATHITLNAVSGDLLAGSAIACVGAWNQFVYAVANDRLQLNGDPVVADIVNLQAQYGVSNAAASNAITSWVNATNTWSAANFGTAARNRIKAVRIAVVARSGLREKEEVTAPCTNGQQDLCVFGGTLSVTMGADSEWRHYRYRVYESTVPLRNVIWNFSSLG